MSSGDQSADWKVFVKQQSLNWSLCPHSCHASGPPSESTILFIPYWEATLPWTGEIPQGLPEYGSLRPSCSLSGLTFLSQRVCYASWRLSCIPYLKSYPPGLPQISSNKILSIFNICVNVPSIRRPLLIILPHSTWCCLSPLGTLSHLFRSAAPKLWCVPESPGELVKNTEAKA